MPKGYWIAHVDVSDPETYRKYVQANAEPIGRFGGRFLVRGGPAENVEGSARSRNVVIEFPSIDAARACYADEAYQRAIELRVAASVADLVIVEGYDGPQPGD